MHPPLQYGIDGLLQNAAAYKNKRIALVTSDAAITGAGERSRTALVKAGFSITHLFSPEHGLNAAGEDGAVQYNHTDPVTGLPVTSLYGEQLQPTAEQLANCDMVLFDIPDIGCRHYTYLWTMTYVMEACAAAQKTLLIADRPNPIGAVLQKAEGPMLDEVHCTSFIGRWNIPLKHACTIGELAQYFAATRIKTASLQVIKLKNYNRHDTALHDFDFTPASPAMQTIQTALLYAGTGLLEGVNINEGRGTDTPFTLLGAPWLQHITLKNELEKKQLPGIAFTAEDYIAVTGPYAHEICHGLRLHITNAHELMAVHTGLTILQTIMQLHPQQVKERLYPTHANPAGTGHLDKLLGIHYAFIKIMRGDKIDTAVPNWAEQMRPYLLY
jgi:uncharacterized protein YbbC (DUF1343 family)